MDPLRMRKKWKGCPLHQSKINMSSFAHSSVWSHINRRVVLECVHNNLVIAKAQSDLLVDEAFVTFINRTGFFLPIKNEEGP